MKSRPVRPIRGFAARPPGFTLLELVVVVAVLAVLATLLLPALARARDTARSGTCLSHLRHWGLGTQLYALDGGGRLPADGKLREGGSSVAASSRRSGSSAGWPWPRSPRLP